MALAKQKLEVMKSNVEEAREYFKLFEYRHLRELQTVLSDEIRDREKEAIAQAKAEINKIAADVGMSLESLLAFKTPKPPTAPGQKSPGRGVYRHPENPLLEWRGRGPQPAWLKELLASGVSFESLRIAD